MPKGYKHTEEWKQKASERMKGNKYGSYKHTAQQIEKTSKGNMKKDLLNIDLTDDEVFEGMMLSDAHLTKLDSEYCNSQFQIDQKEGHEDLVDYLEKYFNDLGFKTRKKRFLRETNYTTEPKITNRLVTLRYPSLTKQRKRWYRGKVKIVPRDIKITPKTLAGWHMGDGSARYTEGLGKGEIILCTESFPIPDLEFLRKKLAEIGIKKTGKNFHSGGYQIRIKDSTSAKKFMDLVKPFMLPSFDKKILEINARSEVGKIPIWKRYLKNCQFVGCKNSSLENMLFCKSHKKFEHKLEKRQGPGRLWQKDPSRKKCKVKGCQLTALKGKNGCTNHRLVDSAPNFEYEPVSSKGPSVRTGCIKPGCNKTALPARPVCNDHKGFAPITPSHHGPLSLWKTDSSRQQCIAKGCKATAEKGREVCSGHRGVSPIKQKNRGHIQAWRIDSSRKKCKVSNCENTAKIGRDVCKNHI